MHREISKDKAWPYIVTVDPVKLPLTLIEVKTHLKISGAAEDTYLTFLITAVTEFAEQYTKIDFITRTYETLRDSFGNSLVIRRNPVQSVSKVEYFKDDVLTLVSTDIYFLTESNTYPHLALKAGQLWPTDEDAREQAVRITFDDGYGDDETDVPDDLREAMLQHLAAMYANRGDCNEGRVGGALSAGAQKFLPIDAQLVYDLRRIRSI